ncbi:BgTH12-04440 [Blumeria graminis f. sp. triticale]|uniref:BgTH12-04440 n=1 Tax=Blumeria graminis f. sp. triticale TaxID=1689686 RepID=A0A9W4D004_BLUGR|nr:BgTH12-04440 [Blumeria graminis f. sp. triticale]
MGRNTPPSEILLEGNVYTETSAKSRAKPRLPAGLADLRNEPGGIGAAISRPKLLSQSSFDPSQELPTVSFEVKTTSPQRPLRQSYVAPTLDPTNFQELTPSIQKPLQSWISEKAELVSPSINSLDMTVSYHTSYSDSIPDFPVPRATGLDLPEDFSRSRKFPVSSYISGDAIPIGWNSTDYASESNDKDESTEGDNNDSYWKATHNTQSYERDNSLQSSETDDDRINDLSNNTSQIEEKTSTLTHKTSRAICSFYDYPQSRLTLETGYDPSGQDNEINRMSIQAANLRKSELFSRVSAMHRPARLDMNAISAAEARGSLTSLTDLILRAKKLESLIDQGKRPGSNIDFDSFNSTQFTTESMDQMDMSSAHSSRQITITPEPIPGLSKSGISAGDENLRANSVSNNNKNVAPSRLYCGFSRGIFIALILLATLIVAITLALVFFFVRSKQHPTAKTLITLDNCATSEKSQCQNSGIPYLLGDGSCACICSNGFTGVTCNKAEAIDCSTTMIVGKNSTLGSSIERLIIDARPEFNIPLNASSVLANFNAADLSCTNENSLVTFNGKSTRVDQVVDSRIGAGNAQLLKRNETSDTPPMALGIPSSYATITTMSDSTTTITITILTTVTPSPLNNESKTTQSVTSTTSTLVSTESPSSSFSSSSSTTTSVSFSPTFPSISSSTTIPLPSSSPPPTKSAALSGFIGSETTLDFARIATLYILQQAGKNQAFNAQRTIQKVLDSQMTNMAQNFSLSGTDSHITIDLLKGSVDLGDGKGVIGNQLSGAQKETKRAIVRKRRRISGQELLRLTY